MKTLALTSLLLMAAPFVAIAQTPSSPGTAILTRMHAAYDGKWYHTLTFVQRTIITRAGKTDSSTWYESLSGPARLRIDTDPLSAGNGSLSTADSTIGVRNGEVTRRSAPGNIFLPLIMGVYLQPVAVTEAQLRAFRFDLARSYTATVDGHPVTVIGTAEPADSVTPQFWIDNDRLIALRVRGTLFGQQLADINLGGYERVGAAWLATRVHILTGTTHQVEEYRDWKANVPLPESLFDVTQWKTAPHWANK